MNKTTSTTIKLLGLVLLILTIPSCDAIIALFSPTGTPSTRVSFQLPSQENRAVTQDNIPNRLLCINSEWSYLNPLRVSVLTIQPGVNSFALPKSGAWLFFFLSVDSSESTSISNEGYLRIPDLDLYSLPLAADAADEFNLGILSVSPEGYNSNLSTLEFAQASGYPISSLEFFGGYDAVALKFLNTDINNNSVLDAEENLNWEFIASYHFRMEYSWLDTSFAGLSEDGSTALNINQAISSGERFGHMLFFTLQPQPEFLSAVSGENINALMRAETDAGDNEYRTEAIGRGEEGIKFACYTDGMQIIAPYDVPHTLILQNEYEYTISNVVFMSPLKNTNKLLIPTPQYHLDSTAQTLESISWNWLLWNGSTYESINQETLSLALGNGELINVKIYTTDNSWYRWFIRTDGLQYTVYDAQQDAIQETMLNTLLDYYSDQIELPLELALTDLSCIIMEYNDFAGNIYSFTWEL